jgi:hypothetical protein
MANKNAAIQFSKIVKSLKKVLDDSIKASAMTPTSKFAADLVVKRTRLGYGVDKNMGAKEKFAKLSPNYVKQRKMFAGLDGSTRPNKSNLTRTGQMLASIQPKVVSGQIIIKPTGAHKGGFSNEQLAKWNEDGSRNRPRRIFLNISELEFNQIKRFYRKTFGDLVRSRK